MSAQASVIINDGAATPVAHTFLPKGTKSVEGKDIATWKDVSPTNAEGFLSMVEHHTPFNSNGMEKFRYVIDVPTLETPGGTGPFVPPPTRAYGGVIVIEVWAHKRATADELKNYAAYAKNFAGHAYFKAAIENREAAW